MMGDENEYKKYRGERQSFLRIFLSSPGAIFGGNRHD